MTSTNEDKLHLFDHPMSSYAQKVRLILREKGLDFSKETPSNLGSGQPNAAFSAANPRMEVPTLLVTPSDSSAAPFSIFNSSAIVMYLEEAYPQHKSIFPKCARARAEARMIDEVCGTQYEALNWAVGEITWFGRAQGAQAEALLAKAREQTAVFLAWLSEKLGDKAFLAGEEFSYADIAAAPVVNRSVINGCGPTEGSPLQAWFQRVSARPSVQETFGEVTEASKALLAAGPGLWKPHSGWRREYRDHRLEWMIKNGAIDIVLQGLKDDNIRFSWP